MSLFCHFLFFSCPFRSFSFPFISVSFLHVLCSFHCLSIHFPFVSCYHFISFIYFPFTLLSLSFPFLILSFLFLSYSFPGISSCFHSFSCHILFCPFMFPSFPLLSSHVPFTTPDSSGCIILQSLHLIKGRGGIHRRWTLGGKRSFVLRVFGAVQSCADTIMGNISSDVQLDNGAS